MKIINRSVLRLFSLSIHFLSRRFNEDFIAGESPYYLFHDFETTLTVTVFQILNLYISTLIATEMTITEKIEKKIS